MYALQVKWFVGGEPIVSPDYQMSNSGDIYTLNIQEVFDEDAGRFTVFAENPHGKTSCSALLHVDMDETDAQSLASQSTISSKQTITQ